jgi:hypothetical protein
VKPGTRVSSLLAQAIRKMNMDAVSMERILNSWTLKLRKIGQYQFNVNPSPACNTLKLSFCDVAFRENSAGSAVLNVNIS